MYIQEQVCQDFFCYSPYVAWDGYIVCSYFFSLLASFLFQGRCGQTIISG